MHRALVRKVEVVEQEAYTPTTVMAKVAEQAVDACKVEGKSLVAREEYFFGKLLDCRMSALMDAAVRMGEADWKSMIE